MTAKSRANIKDEAYRVFNSRQAVALNDVADSFVNKIDESYPEATVLDKTAHDLLNHAGLPGIHALYADAETAASISALLLTSLQLTRTNYIYHAVSKTADTVGDSRTFADASRLYTQYCTVANATKGSGTWVNHSGLKNVKAVAAATYDLLITDDILHVTYTATGGVAIDLKTAQVTAGRCLVIKDAGGNAAANNITVTTEGGEKIDGADTAVINSNYSSINLYCDGTNWFIY